MKALKFGNLKPADLKEFVGKYLAEVYTIWDFSEDVPCCPTFNVALTLRFENNDLLLLSTPTGKLTAFSGVVDTEQDLEKHFELSQDDPIPYLNWTPHPSSKLRNLIGTRCRKADKLSSGSIMFEFEQALPLIVDGREAKLIKELLVTRKQIVMQEESFKRSLKEALVH